MLGRTLKKNATIAGTVICLSVGCLWLTNHLHSRREPVHGGKPVSYWARQSRHAVVDDSVRALRQMGSIAVPYLTNQLTLKDGPLQKSWLWIWAKLPTAVRVGLPQPVKAAELRAAAAWDLLQLGPAAKDAVPSLIAALKDDDFFVRLNAAAAFGQIGPQAASAIPALISALTNQYRGVRFNSAYSLELLGPLAKDAIPALKVTLSDSDPEVRAKAKEALEKIEPSTSQSAP